MKKISSSILFFLFGTFGMAFSQDYELVWEETFDGSELNMDVWNIETEWGPWNWGANQELQQYSEGNVSVGPDGEGNNALILTAKREDVGHAEFTSGRVNTRGKVSALFGKIEARIKLPVLENGLWPAFWTLGVEKNWPDCGEMDIMETGHSDGISNDIQDRYVVSAHHWEAGGGHAMYAGNYTMPGDESLYEYNVFTLEWTPTMTTMYVNGNQIHAMNIAGEGEYAFRTWSHYLILNLAVGGSFTGITNSDQISAPMPANMYIDWVRVYQRDGEGEFYGPGDTPVISESDWDSWTGEGGAASFDIQEDGGVVTVTEAGTQPWSIQLFKDDISLPDGDYTLTFTAKADDPRPIQVNLGKGLNADPWFEAFMDTEMFNVTGDWQNFSLDITKNNAYDDGKLVFELGNIEGNGTLNTTIYLDQISLIPSSATKIEGVNSENSISVFPNPAYEQFSLNLNGKAIAVEVLNFLGQSVFTQYNLSGASNLTIGCAQWSRGVYIIKVSLENGEQEIIKLVVR